MTRLRSVRATLIAAVLLVVSLPALMLVFAWGYERGIVGRYRALVMKTAEGAAKGAGGLAAAAVENDVYVRVLGRAGNVEGDSENSLDAVEPSLIGGLASSVLEEITGPPAVEYLADVDKELEPIAERAEVKAALAGKPGFAWRQSPAGQMVIFYYSLPRPEGGVVYAAKGSRRGVRRLFVMKSDLAKLTAYQGVLAVVLALFFGRRLVRPLEKLAAAARRYPAQPLADEQLLARKDEIGDLARSTMAMAADLEERRRATADLGADVAHELKNPLATIAASAELIAATKELTPEKAAMVGTRVGEAVERLRRSIDALLALVRLEAALPEEPRETLDYARFLEELVAEYRSDPRHAAFQIRVEASPEPGPVTVVRARWAEMLRNLIDNALAQPAERREVVVAARRTSAGVMTSVRDFGPGISEGNADKIFRRFFTQRPEGAPPGTGLGLSIVQAVAAAHGARVEVDSKPGEGAEFRVVLPA